MHDDKDGGHSTMSQLSARRRPGGLTVGDRWKVRGMLCRSGQVLLCRRRAAAFDPAVWDLPGGHVAVGEQLSTALARVCRNDLGVDVAASKGIAVIEPSPGEHLSVRLISTWHGCPRTVTAAVLTAGPFAVVHLPLLIVPPITAGQLLIGAGGLAVLAVVVRLLAAPSHSAAGASCPPPCCTGVSTPRPTRAACSTRCCPEPTPTCSGRRRPRSSLSASWASTGRPGLVSTVPIP